jgi:DNA-binding NarL/FixJ family response regulator
LRRTRILLVEMPQILCDIIAAAVSGQGDLEMVGRLDNRRAILSKTSDTEADVVVIGLADSDLPQECLSLFEALPHVRVIGVAADGRRAFLYELRPLRTALGELSPDALVQAIRENR